jgi:hypothetical protein
MLKKIISLFTDIRVRQVININLSRGLTSMLSRSIDFKDPKSWEFSGFSQNGEDGIINILIQKLKKNNNYFIEIGSADGLQNNTSWLLITNNFQGLMVEGNKSLRDVAQRHIIPYGIGTIYKNIFIDLDNVDEIQKNSTYLDPDLFSVDIDGNDYHIVKKLFEIGFRPKVFVVEYNSSFGPTKSITIKYRSKLTSKNHHPSELYFGVSVNAWKKLFTKNGYRFVTVDTNGVNAFFVNPLYFDEEFLDKIQGLDFVDNKFFSKKFNNNYNEQFKLISNLEYIEVD